ncbi:MAG: polysaccharide biosynthesis protein [Eubacteriales bacterium]|nr:polysaccharide biosynthesis protein [Eubacteriales bacterium]
MPEENNIANQTAPEPGSGDAAVEEKREEADKSQKFIKGAAILAMSGLVVKVLGAFFRIPLSNWIGGEGMSYYSVAYNVYGALLVFSTAGFPIAISRQVSGHLAVKEYRAARQVLRVALKIMLCFGTISFAICFFGGGAISAFIKNTGATMALRAISPALLIVPLFSAFRGYFNGRQNMNPTALSEISEQLVRVVVGLTLAYVLIPKGEKAVAAGASFGASAGSLAGLLVITLIYALNHKGFSYQVKHGSQRVDSDWTIAKTIIAIAVPIIIGSEIFPMMNLIDTAMSMRVLQSSGWSATESKYLYGLLSGFCSPIIAFPQIMTQAVSVSLVPAVSAMYKLNNREGIIDNIQLGYRTTMILAAPCSLGMFALAEPILKLLYFQRPQDCHDAAPILMIMSISILFMAIMQTSTAALQAVGKQMIPVRNLAIGVAGKFVVTYFLLKVHSININGTASGTIFAYIVAMLLNAYYVKKYTGARMNLMLTYVKPVVASAIMAVCAYGIYHGVVHFAGTGMAGNGLGTLIAILCAVIIYAVLILVVKAIKVDELSMMPAGDKLAKIVSHFVR